jgi:hypothetical protein
MTLCCDNCQGEEFYTLVSGGSYYFRCSNCLSIGPATSWLSIKVEIKGWYEIIEVDNLMNQLQLLTTGDIQNHIEMITKEAHAGKIIWLKATRLD